MSRKATIKRNMIWNSAGLIVEMGTAFLVMPFLIATLGASTYGIWLVLGALTSYFGLLELGVRGAIGRHIAFYHSQRDQALVNQTLSGGILVLLTIGTLTTGVLLLCERWFFQYFAIPIDQQADVSLAYRLVAINFTVTLLGAAFDSTLWGFQRFDSINAVGIPVSLLRLGLTFVLIQSSNDLVALASLTLALSLVNGLSKAILAFLANPQLRIGLRSVQRAILWQLFGYGSWNAIRTVAQLTRNQLGPILIGAMIGLAMVPVFSVANRLLLTVGAAIVALTGVLTPYATSLHATNQIDKQRVLMIEGGRRIATLGLFLAGYLFVLGGPFIGLWVGPSFTVSATLLLILVAGESLPSTQYVTNGIILAMARHRSLALFAVLEAVAVSGLMIALLPSLGMVGVGLSIAIPAFLARGVGTMVHGCRITGISLKEYLKKTIVPPLACALLPVVLLEMVMRQNQSVTWLSFIACSIAYTLLFLVIYLCIFRRSHHLGSITCAQSATTGVHRIFNTAKSEAIDPATEVTKS